MKTANKYLFNVGLMVATLACFTQAALAQISNHPPVVNIIADDPHASETGPDPGSFLVQRLDGTNRNLRVFYAIGGTAGNGVDYLAISNSVTIPAGEFNAHIIITPIDDNIAEGPETVTLTLVPSATTTPDYTVGQQNRATVVIEDNDGVRTNHPPDIAIISPREGEIFRAPATIPICTVTHDDGFVVAVEFFAGTNSLGVVTNPPFCFVWSNVIAGPYELSAVATDNDGATWRSQPVHILVVPPGPPVVTIFARDPIASEGTNFWHWPVPLWRSNWWDHEYWPSNWWSARWCSNSFGPTPRPGTNTALFLVERHDGTNSDLVVNYSIGGTASNGVDYLPLSGTVTIPAGHRTAPIVIWPLDDEDNSPFPIETVILTLLPDAAYRLGEPHRAAAIIVDNDDHRPATTVLGDGSFHLCLPGVNGAAYRVEATSNLSDWTLLTIGAVNDGAIHFVDPDANGQSARFYRVSPEPAPPPSN